MSKKRSASHPAWLSTPEVIGHMTLPPLCFDQFIQRWTPSRRPISTDGRDHPCWPTVEADTNRSDHQAGRHIDVMTQCNASRRVNTRLPKVTKERLDSHVSCSGRWSLQPLPLSSLSAASHRPRHSLLPRINRTPHSPVPPVCPPRRVSQHAACLPVKSIPRRRSRSCCHGGSGPSQ